MSKDFLPKQISGEKTSCKIKMYKSIQKVHVLSPKPMVGSANRRIDIFKITCKVLLCVGVGLIKKTLSWNQILCIPEGSDTSEISYTLAEITEITKSEITVLSKLSVKFRKLQ